MTRGLRNNNPGNIRKDGTHWKGEVEPSRDAAFKQFESMAWGYRAMFKCLNTYSRKYGLDTIRKMISRWAPPSENDTDAYIRNESVIVAVDSFTKEEIKSIEKVADIIPITMDQAHTGLTNSVRVNNYLLNASDIDFLSKRSEDYRYESDKNRRLEQIAADNAMEVCYFNLEEYMKGGGLLSCLVLHVNYERMLTKLI